MLNDTTDDLAKGQNVSLLVSFDSLEDVKRVYEILKVDVEILTPLQELSYSSSFASPIAVMAGAGS